MREPRWVPRLVVDSVHVDQLREHGGLPGVRDENALEAALARPRQKWNYEPESDLSVLAAAYAFGVAKAHPFNDGNKRTACPDFRTDSGSASSRPKAPSLIVGYQKRPPFAPSSHHRTVP